MKVKRNPPAKRKAKPRPVVRRIPPKKKTSPPVNRGGHMKDPPADCPLKDRYWVTEIDGSLWIDVNLCQRACPINLCDKFKEYRKTWRSI